MDISLRQNRALKLCSLQGTLVATILLRTYDDHEAAGLLCPMLVRCVGAGHVLGRWPWSGGILGRQLAPPPGVGDALTAEGIVMRVNVHAPASNDHSDPLLRAAERVLAQTWGDEVR